MKLSQPQWRIDFSKYLPEPDISDALELTIIIEVTQCLCERTYRAPTGTFLTKHNQPGGASVYLPTATPALYRHLPFTELISHRKIPICHQCCHETFATVDLFSLSPEDFRARYREIHRCSDPHAVEEALAHIARREEWSTGQHISVNLAPHAADDFDADELSTTPTWDSV